MPAQHLSGDPQTGNTPAKLPAGLYVVATPIGNLRDITLRALDVLRSVDAVLAEDTRQTIKLLNAYDIKAPISAYHDHNAAERVPAIIQRLQDGEAIALVSDAGTPLVSDPGFRLVRAAVEAGIEVTPLPGASAPLAALVKSGLPSDAFLFAGFMPTKSAARQTAMTAFQDLRATLIFFETGKRIIAMLTDALAVYGDRPAVLTRELTKQYEEARHGTISELITSVTDTPPRGEIVMLIGPASGDRTWDAALVTRALQEQIPELGMKRASAEVAAQSGWPKRDVYQLALSLK
ncbi:16S rRNA (cytidine(1402)-2'-O)-methyltransferase [Litorimonas sp. RW-G-Af-16]|uniref:16S rRNA (cytidine(1402)-2'-O)-methyltransferase n=1 Tax=Litorimonas sp. RW-G-Af-16 TaxID=3241168 RepID=UPI00390C9289